MAREMCVAFDATPLQAARSRIGMYTENLVRALLETLECEVVLLSNRAPFPGPELEHVRCHEEDRFPIRAVWMQAILPRILTRVQPSLCHFPTYLAPLRAPCPRVVTLHDMSLFRHPEFFSVRQRHLSRRLLPLVARRAEGIVTVSEYSRREIVDLLGVPPRRVHVIYEAAAPGFRPVRDPATLGDIRRRYGLQSRYILSVGTIEPRKNIGRLLTAFERLTAHAFRDVQLILVGAPGRKNGDLQARIAESQRRGRVKYLGYVPQADLPALYSLASAVAYPSVCEGFGLPVLEAMACGTPVLTSDRASMAEIAGPAACLIDPEDTEAIQRGLEAILGHPDLAAELSGRGRERAGRYSWTETAERTLEVYRDVQRAGTRPARAPSLPGERDSAGICRSILRTVIYADLFNSPIAIDSLHRHLIGCRATREEVEHLLREDPWLRDRIICRDDLVRLSNRDDPAGRVAGQRSETRELIRRNRRLLRVLSLLPFVRLAAFSGGTSHENSPGRPDLDLFFVTARGRVWTVYGLVVLLCRLCGRRRIICANYLVDTDHLRLRRSGDLFTGHELLFLKPLAGAGWADRLLEANGWIRELFPNAGPLSREHLRPGNPLLQRTAEFVLWPVWSLGGAIARRLFKARIDRRRRASPSADVVVEDGILKLHIQDRRAQAIARFRERLQDAGVWTPARDACLRLDSPAEAEPARSTAEPAGAVRDAATPEIGPCDLLLVHPYALSLDDSRFQEPPPYPPLGLLMVAAVAREAGYRVAIYDGTFSGQLGDLSESLRRHRPRLVGVGSWSSYRANARRTIREVKRAGLPVIAGGPDPSIYPDAYLEAGADLVVIGEGEETARDLLRALLGSPGTSEDPVVLEPRQLRMIPGLALHGGVRTAVRKRVDRLEELPLPAYDLVPTVRYLNAWRERSGTTSLPIMTARGCPFECTWCARPSFGRVYRQRPVAHVMEELRYLVGTLGARYIRILDDTFVISRNWLEEWSEAVEASGLDFRYECLARVELLTDPVVEALRRSGCVKVFCGVESGSQKVLDAMKKGTTVEQIESAGRRLRKAGIALHAYLMFGYPGERHRDVRRTLALLRRLGPEEHSISIAYPMPGTEFYEQVHALMPDRVWKNRDDAEPQFEADYGRNYYRLARAIARRRYARGHPRDVMERLEGWMLEAFFVPVRWWDEVARRGPTVSARRRIAARTVLDD